jgi:hypothetical protein
MVANFNFARRKMAYAKDLSVPILTIDPWP